MLPPLRTSRRVTRRPGGSTVRNPCVPVIDAVFELPVDGILLELTHADDAGRDRGRDPGLPTERLSVHPDAGLRTLEAVTAEAKLRAMIEAARCYNRPGSE